MKQIDYSEILSKVIYPDATGRFALYIKDMPITGEIAIQAMREVLNKSLELLPTIDEVKSESHIQCYADNDVEFGFLKGAEWMREQLIKSIKENVI